MTFDRKKLDEHKAKRQQWEETTLRQTLERLPERQDEFFTTSSMPIERVYSPQDIEDFDYEHDLGMPGEYPFTRGIHATGYRGKLWTMRMFAGFGTAEETNARYHYLLKEGNMGLSVAFDLP
ncbi:MAG: methylmalonyl-CoA mutase, partial [Chloroflexi bacterium]